MNAIQYQQIQGCGCHYACGKQDVYVAYGGCEEISHKHSAASCQHEWSYIFYGTKEGVSYFLIEEIVPDACPANDYCCIRDDHHVYAAEGMVPSEYVYFCPATEKKMDGQGDGEDDASLGYDVPHVYVGFASGYYQVEV